MVIGRVADATRKANGVRARFCELFRHSNRIKTAKMANVFVPWSRSGLAAFLLNLPKKLGVVIQTKSRLPRLPTFCHIPPTFPFFWQNSSGFWRVWYATSRRESIGSMSENENGPAIARWAAWEWASPPLAGDSA